MKFNFIASGAQGVSRRKAGITAQNFFLSEENVGYMSAETFQPMMAQMKEHAPKLYKQYNEFFNCMREGFLIRNSVTKKTHLKNLSDYYYLIMSKGRVKVEVTIYDVENIGKLIHDYADGLIDVQFGLEDLIAECSK